MGPVRGLAVGGIIVFYLAMKMPYWSELKGVAHEHGYWLILALVAILTGALLFRDAIRSPAPPANVPSIQVGGTTANGQQRFPSETFIAISSMITAIVAIAALIFTAGSLHQAQNQNRIAEQGQITERYAQAISQLGEASDINVNPFEHLATRIGAVFSLARLAKDSPRDQETVRRVLAGFVRSSTFQIDSKAGCPDRAGADVEAALIVLTLYGVSPVAESKIRADLRGSCLTSVNIVSDSVPVGSVPRGGYQQYGLFGC